LLKPFISEVWIVRDGRVEINYEFLITNYEINFEKVSWMKSGNIIQEKSFALAIVAIKIVRKLQTEKNEFVLSNQLLKAATSVGANIEESIGGQSRKDFLAKISIAYKEARETIYWIKLLHGTDLLTKDEFESIWKIADECCRIIGKIQTTLKIKGV